MTKRSHSEIMAIEDVRSWVREERKVRGWSARKLAEEAKLAAQRLNKQTDVSQQSVSSFENGHKKSLPSWITFAAAAFEDTPRPASLQMIAASTQFTKAPCAKKIPPENDLRKIFLSLLAPLDFNPHDVWSSKQQIAASLAKRFPVVMSHPQAFIDM
ncbi:MAG: helix-turn-helix transcriptional regulator [Zymomonas mobilis]